MIVLTAPANGARVSLLQEKHLAYLKKPANDPTSKVDWLNLRETQDDLSYPRTLVFLANIAESAELILRHGTCEQRFPMENGRAEVTGLLLDTEYVWHVQKGSECSEKRRFHTDAQPPRMLFVEGISNVRDIGGFYTADGRARVRQELVYRTSEMDCHVSITDQGKKTLLDLGIRTDLDLRGVKNEPRGPVLDETRVRWVNIPLAAYVESLTEAQRPLWRESFALLCDRKNYPLMVHCWGGIDRTGCWLYVLGALLGVSETDLSLDYEMSSFSRWGRRSRYSEQFREFLAGLGAFGTGPKTAAEEFLHSCGLCSKEIEQIREILLEPAKHSVP